MQNIIFQFVGQICAEWIILADDQECQLMRSWCHPNYRARGLKVENKSGITKKSSTKKIDGILLPRVLLVVTTITNLDYNPKWWLTPHKLCKNTHSRSNRWIFSHSHSYHFSLKWIWVYGFCYKMCIQCTGIFFPYCEATDLLPSQCIHRIQILVIQWDGEWANIYSICC